MPDTKIQNRIELNNDDIKLNGVSIDPTHLELILKPNGLLTIKLELEGLVEFSDVDIKFD